MKTICISLVVAFSLMSFSPNPVMENTIFKTSGPVAIAWKSEAINVGEIPQGKPKEIEFTFTNQGKSDVIIVNVKASCGCTSTDYTKAPIKPGQTAFVKATFNAANKGPFSKTVTVTTNAEDAPKVLTFKGSVI